ncbi:MAG: TIGR01212 family radical SAM protein [Lachnospiraceae bacterium]|nr:TIGR01212 family radical SAM protein [Lachnospiraceae bacterium]MEE0687130.1 TIGR01212 family radical SAM protein [Lachnospiraceae bacterium]
MYINDLNSYLKNRFGKKIYKISLDAGMTCPNRDGTIDTRGCIFCSEGGSGDFAGSCSLSITEQINTGKTLVSKKIKNEDNTGQYIAYFQAYTNTYAPIDRLRTIYMEAATNKDIVAISIATRPDCIDAQIMDLIYEIHQIKPVFIELGLQTSNEESASFIRRGYTNKIFEDAINLITIYNDKLHSNNPIHIVVHTIIGLPNEDYPVMLETIKYINQFPIHGIKLQLLHILTNTDLAKEYEKNPFKVLSLEEYTDILIKLLENLREDIVIHRMTGDGPKNILIAPEWSKNKRNVLNYINKQLTLRDTVQGRCYSQDKGEY